MKKNQLFVHVKSGKLYKFKGLEIGEEDYSPHVRYKSLDTGETYTRKASLFFDGRFVLFNSRSMLNVGTPSGV